MNKYLIFDIGGTFIKYAIINDEFKFIFKNKFAYDNDRYDGVWLANEIKNKVKEMIIKYSDLKGIGISTAGDVDNQTGIILGATPNHKNYLGTNFKEILKEFKLPVVIENDANAATYGEKILGNLANINFAIMLTLGTCIGCGVLIDGKIYRGHNNLAAQAGHMNVLGFRWGKYFSTKGLANLTQLQLKQKMDPIEILKSKDVKLQKVVNYWYNGLAIGIANLIMTFNPQKILIGGGISETDLFDLAKLKEMIDKHIIEDHWSKSYQIGLAKLGNDAAIVGMCSLLNQKANTREHLLLKKENNLQDDNKNISKSKNEDDSVEDEISKYEDYFSTW